MVVEAIYYHGEAMGHYQLHNFVVMANHVHLLITPHVPVSKLMQSLKRFTTREANRILGVINQPFWQDESYDRLIRDDTEFEKIANYIDMNPVTAGVVTSPEEFLGSSGKRIANPPPVANLPHREEVPSF